MAKKLRPQGLKPGDCLQLFAALKRRSSTQAPAFHAKAILQSRLDKPSLPEGPPNTLDAASEFRRRGRRPDPEPRRLVRQRCEFREFPTSPCRRGFRPARCDKVFANWFRPPAGLPIAVAVRAAPQPGCSDSCCRSLRSISWILSPLNTRMLNLIAESCCASFFAGGAKNCSPIFPRNSMLRG